MYSISKRFEFAASHVLEGLAPGHKCGRLHGHNYVVEVFLESEGLDRHGFVMDYGDLSDLKDYLDTTFDHRHLNDNVALMEAHTNPTAEVLAEFLFAWCVDQAWPVVKVGVSETPKTWAWWTR